LRPWSKLLLQLILQQQVASKELLALQVKKIKNQQFLKTIFS